MERVAKEDPNLKPKVKKETWPRIVRLFRPYRAQVIGTAITVLFGVVLGLLPPWFLRVIIDQGLQHNRFDVTTTYSIWTIVVTIAGAGVTLLYGYWSVVIGQQIMCDLRHKLFDHLQDMSLRFFTTTRAGEIQTRLISDVSGVQNVVSSTATDALSNFSIVVTSLVMMFIFDWRLTLLSIAMVPLVALMGSKLGSFARKIRTGTQEQTAELNVMMQENLSVSGLLLTKTTGRRAGLLAQFDKESRRLADWQIKGMVLQYLFFGMIRGITSLAPSLVFWFAGFLIFRGEKISVGTLVAFTSLQTRMFFPLTGLLSVQVEFISSLALFDRIFEYLDLKPEIVDKPDALALAPEEVRGAVKFESVWFRYDPEGAWTLSDIDFEAEPGQLVALVGPSGAGKTTVSYLIPRLYEAERGRVMIDGFDVKDMTQQSLGEFVGAVLQETYLVHDTVRENLRIAKPSASNEEIEDACRAAAIHDHVASLPEGYDTVVGERGYKFSGGEKQRLAIARAILRNPKILILDEATSALDTRSERLIQDSLNSLTKGRTTFAIAHRLSTVLRADQILVLDGGRVIERGRHPELLAKGGMYARLYHEQFEDAPDVRILSSTEPRPSE